MQVDEETRDKLKKIKELILTLSEIYPLSGIARDIGMPYNTLWHFVYISTRVPTARNCTLLLNWSKSECGSRDYVDLSLLNAIQYHIRQLLEDVSIYKISKESGIPYSTLYKFVMGRGSVPREPFITKIVAWYRQDNLRERLWVERATN